MSESTSVPSTSWKTEFDKRIKAFANTIGVPEDKVLVELTKLGVDGENDQSLTIIDSEEFLPTGDLFSAFVDSGLTQKAKVRLGLPHLRGKTNLSVDNSTSVLDKVTSALEKITASNRRIEDWTDEEIVNGYSLDRPEIVEELSRRAKARWCIVLNSDGSVNVPVTLELLKVARRQPTTDTYLVSGRLVRVYRAGDQVEQMFDESPFFPNTMLINGICTKSATDWKNVSQESRILVRMQVEIENKQLSDRDMRIMCDEARQGADKFREMYPKASLRYDELKDKDQLPKLKVSSRVVNTPRKDNGF